MRIMVTIFSLEKTNNKRGKQTNNVNNNRLKEKEKKSKPLDTRFLVTSFPVTLLRVLLTTDHGEW